MDASTESVERKESEEPFGLITPTSDTDELLDVAELGWQVEKGKLWVEADSPSEEGEEYDDELDDELGGINHWVALRRSDTKKVFNIPTKGYGIVQNREVFEFVHPILEEAEAVYSRAGFLQGGGEIFAFLDIGKEIIIDEAPYSANTVVQSSHNGSVSVTIRFVISSQDGGVVFPVPDSISGRPLKFRHTRRVALKMDEVNHVIRSQNAIFKKLEDVSRKMTQIPITRKTAEKILKKALKFPEDPETEAKAGKQRAFDRVWSTWRRMNPSVEFKEKQFRSVWSVFAAGLYYKNSSDSPVRVVRAESSEEARFDSVLNGASRDFFNRLWSLLTVEMLKIQQRMK